ncbi:MAG: NACHT domain-containing protein [Caldilinea sp. CFX5]|nr:NACHT domain-containing protein [Caldilinea sp. CFX5]
MSNLTSTPEEQLAALRKSIAELTAANVSTLVIASLQQQLTQIEAQIQTSGGALVGHDVVTSGGAFVGRDQQIHGDLVRGDKIIQNPEQVAPEDLLAAYHRDLNREACRLPLGFIDETYVHSRGEQGPPLPDIFVDLDVVAPLPRAEESEQGWALRLARGQGDERLALLAALAQPEQRYTVLLGDAGSGKSTCVNYLVYLLTAPGTAPAHFQNRLVVRLILREVAAQQIPANAPRGTAQMLWDALHADISRTLGKASADKLFPYLQARLCREGGVILLDGLDEVPQANRRRQALVEAVTALVHLLPPAQSQVLVTARPYAYAEKAWQLPNFTTLALAPFTAAQVEQFLARWHQAVRPALGWNEATARAKSAELHAALSGQPYLADLAARPLLLTLMATLHSSWGTLPHDRAQLYEEAVNLLLARWQKAREVRGPDDALVVEPAITQALGVGLPRIRTALETLAWRAHDAQRQAGYSATAATDSAAADNEAADIEEGEVLKALKPLSGAIDTDTLLAYLQDRAGLLLARREGRYAFPHRSFQEYLAACHLTEQPDAAQRLRTLAQQDPAWWREVVLLAIGKRKQGGLGAATEMVNTLLGGAFAEFKSVTDNQWRLATMAGLAVEELRLPEQAEPDEFYTLLLDRVRNWLAHLVAGGHLPPRERLAAGDLLGRLGDPRPGVGVLVRPGQPDRPDIVWVAIPAGPFIMGSADDDELAYGDEKPQHTLTLPTFYMARYPLTNAQFRPFIAAGGYDDAQWWTAEGWAWRQGADADLSPIDNEEVKKTYERWLAGRPAKERNQPYWWDHPQWGAANRPVVGISWYEALAYSRWLNATLQSAAQPLSLWPQGHCSFPGAYAVRLPTEAEWEKAARGQNGWRWSWGNEWQPGLCNSEEIALAQTSTVGAFPGSVNSYGLEDMTGNVWEWTQTRWGRQSLYRPDYSYPYRSDDGREDLAGPDLHILRGGSYYHEQRIVRCAYRDRSIPDNFFDDDGVRLVVSLASCC